MQQLIQLSHATTNTHLAELGLEAGRDTALIWHSKGALAKVRAQTREPTDISAPQIRGK